MNKHVNTYQTSHSFFVLPNVALKLQTKRGNRGKSLIISRHSLGRHNTTKSQFITSEVGLDPSRWCAGQSDESEKDEEVFELCHLSVDHTASSRKPKHSTKSTALLSSLTALHQSVEEKIEPVQEEEGGKRAANSSESVDIVCWHGCVLQNRPFSSSLRETGWRKGRLVSVVSLSSCINVKRCVFKRYDTNGRQLWMLWNNLIIQRLNPMIQKQNTWAFYLLSHNHFNV